VCSLTAVPHVLDVGGDERVSVTPLLTDLQMSNDIKYEFICY
jgi:hypothetical protein